MLLKKSLCSCLVFISLSPMYTTEVPPVEYWQVLAEQRRLALAETLKENEEVRITLIHGWSFVGYVG